MPLIKRTDAVPLTKTALVLDLGDLRRQAVNILDEAKAEAARIVAEAGEEARRLVESADERGFAEGRERGMIAGREEGWREGRETAIATCADELRTLTEAWETALRDWETRRAEMLLGAREDVLALALAVARKIVVRLPEIDPTLVRDQVAETLALLCRPSAVTIVIHPDDRPLLEEVLPAVLATAARCEHAEIETDAAVDRGGCRVRTADGSIDATIRTQIDRIVRTLLPGADGASA